MPSNFDLPRKNRKALGEALASAIDTAKHQDLAPQLAQAKAARQYLLGNRYFDIEDPHNPGYVLMRVENPIDAPAFEQLVSDTSKELGRQLRIDPRPRIGKEDTTLSGVRKSAVAQGVLSYYFPDAVLSSAHRGLHKYRLEMGCGGLAVSETFYPGRGWGLRVDAIPVDQLIFLPVGVRSWEQVHLIDWRRWVPLRWLRTMLANVEDEMGPVTIPRKDSPDYKRMDVVEVPHGETIDQVLGAGHSFALPMPALTYGDVSGAAHADVDTVPFVEFHQMYVTPNRRHAERITFQAGRHVLYDRQYPETRMPLLPVGRAVYADVGGPYGRSYVYPKMGAAIMAERFLTALSRNASEVDAYGVIAASYQMGLNLEELKRPSNGPRIIQYNADPISPSLQPAQLMPAPLNQIFGTMPGLFLGAAAAVYPDTPIHSGEAPGRVDSNSALQSLDAFSSIQVEGGAQSVKEAWVQVYAAGLEKARNHHEEGDAIPLTYLSEDMAGVVLETEEAPMSQDELLQYQQGLESQMEGLAMQGVDPLLARGMLLQQGRMQPPSRRIPVGRFRIGPNVIPHPDEVDIQIRSLLPRNMEKEFGELGAMVQMGAMSIVEMQIEVYKRGLPQIVGGRAAWNAYRMAILNLLSAYGDGTEAGPVPDVTMVPSHRIGAWVVNTFRDSPEYMLASQRVRQQVDLLAQMYGPGNTMGTQPTLDEMAGMEQMRQQSIQRGMAGPNGRPNPGGPQPRRRAG